MTAVKEASIDKYLKFQERQMFGKTVVPSSNGWIVKTSTVPVKKRHYHGKEIDWSEVSCVDPETGMYRNVEYFQPVIYDLDNKPPEYNPRWEVWKGTGRQKKLVRIDFPSSYRNYWEEQAKRCLLGYEVGGVKLTGFYYFFLNFWRIKGKKIGSGFIVPRFYDVHKYICDELKRAQDLNKNIMFLKRRQIGCSELFGAYNAYMYSMFPGSESLIVGGEGAYADNTFKKVREGLDEFGRNSESRSADAFYKRRLKDTEDEMVSGFMDEGTKVGFRSRILSITVKDNVQRASGKSPHFVLMEESGRNRFLKIVYQMILESVQEGGLQDGRLIAFIGTGGEMDKGVADMMQMYYDPVKYNLLDVENEWDFDGTTGSSCCHFLPCWMYYVTDHDGNSYKDIGLAIVDEVLARMEGDLEAVHVYKTQMPKTPTDAFSSSGLSPFDSVKLTEQRTRIQVNKWDRLAQRGRFDWELDGKGKRIGVRWTGADNPAALDDDGDHRYPWLLWEHPEMPGMDSPTGLGVDLRDNVVSFLADRYLNLYTAGTDPYDKDDAPSSTSLGSCSFFKGMREDALSTSTSMLYTARLTWRPAKAEKFYEETAKGCMYFGAKNLIEWSNVGIFNWYSANGFEFLLKERPLLGMAAFKNSKMSNKFGIDPQSKPYWINNYKAFIKDYSQNMYDFEQVQRALAYRRATGSKKFNDDITDSAMLAYQHYLDNNDRKLKVVARQKRKKGARPLFGVVSYNGQMLKVG